MNQEVINEINKEMILNAEIQRQNLKALPKKFKTNKVMSLNSQKMIDDYRQQFNKKAGDKSYLFPELTPRLIDMTRELDKLAQPLSDHDVVTLTESIKTLVDHYQLLETVTLPGYRKRIEDLKQERNTTNDLLGQKSKSSNKRLRNKKRQLEEGITRYEQLIIHGIAEMTDLKLHSDRFKEAIVTNNETADNYANVRHSIISKNKDLVRDYENNIRILNEGKINITPMN
jgi:hypothetical protein